MQKEITDLKNREKIGKRYRVVLDGALKESDLLIKARAFYQTPEIDSSIIINDRDKISDFNKRYLVEIVDSLEYDLLGEVVRCL